VPNERIVEVLEFATDAPVLRSEMTITFTLSDAEGGTDIHAPHDGQPPGVPAGDRRREGLTFYGGYTRSIRSTPTASRSCSGTVRAKCGSW
jgi:hypothetical protein